MNEHSTFDLSHLHRTSFDMGKLFPIACIPTIPGDYIKADVEAFIRGMPTIAPIVDKVDIKINHFYVPYRVLWNKFEEFITHDDTYRGLGLVKPTLPKIKVSHIQQEGATKYMYGKLANYLGIPDNVATNEISALPFLAYQRIVLDYYSPQRWVEYLSSNGTLHNLAWIKNVLENAKRSEGGVLPEEWSELITTMKNVGWNHDYFTNALPTPNLYQDIKIPLLSSFNETYPEQTGQGAGFLEVEEGNLQFQNSQVGDANFAKLGTIRNLRQAVTMQQYLEKLQQGGGRYMETMKVMWNQNLRNQQLQRPEYLGGDQIPLFVNEVESTAATDKAALGDLGGKPLGAGRFDNINFQADEFGIYMVIAHVAPKRSYNTTLNKMWKLEDPLDFPNPQFEGIGDQEVRLWELNATDGFESDKIFGYVPRYSEYKGHVDRFSGEMQHSLKHWHLGTTTSEIQPYKEISPEFIECNPRNDIFVVRTEPDKFLGTFQINVKAKRKLSVNPVSGVSRI